MEEIIKNSPIVFFLGALASGFVAGISSYMALLRITNQETVIKDSYELKKNLVGRVLKNEVLNECGRLINEGDRLDASAAPQKVRVFLTQTQVFLEGLDLPKVQQYGQVMMSWPAYTLQLSLVKSEMPLAEKLGHAIGALEGLRSSFKSTAGS